LRSAVVVLAGALLKQCLDLLGKGIHPTTISEALHKASEKAIEVRLAALVARLSGYVCVLCCRHFWYSTNYLRIFVFKGDAEYFWPVCLSI
jgi:hypothetical protein